MPPLETETALESYERGRFEPRVSSQELSSLCSMIKRLMTDRLRQREPRLGAAAAAIAALVRQPGAPRAGAAALARQPAAPRPVVAPQEEPEGGAPPQEEPECSSDGSSNDSSSSNSSDDSSSSSSIDGNSSSNDSSNCDDSSSSSIDGGGSSSPPKPESKPRGAPARSRRFNLRLIGVPEAEDKANEAQAVLEQLVAENFPELQNHHRRRRGAGPSLQIAKAHRVPSRFDAQKATPRHILVTFLRLGDKERLLRLARQRQELTFQGVAVRLAADFSPRVLQARRQWSGAYRALLQKQCQPRVLYPARLSFVYRGERKTFLDVQALEEFVAQAPSLRNLLGDAALPEGKESSED